MSYTVLARKYRSQTFDEIVGQEAIATTLKNAVASGRIHHGYLFTGTRGVGKTSMARILAKALNCLSAEAPTIEPCCTCELCTSVAEGSDVDVIEIDAASNTGVDNIRELRGNTAYRPARARFKVYIIDEVHMLSQGAFNALLKTLEEPPEHVKFVLATTEPQRVPATIHSRCQRFDFRSISVDKIAGQLRLILEAEGVGADDEVIRRVARLANGSMRDGLSLLDQLLSLGAEALAAELIDEILPAPHAETVGDLVECLSQGDAAGALAQLDAVLNEGHSLELVCSSLIDTFRQMLVIGVCGAETELVDVPQPVRERLGEQAGRYDAAALTYMIAVIEELRRSVRFSGSGRALTEAALVRLACMERFSSIEAMLAGLDKRMGSGGSQPSARPGASASDAKGKVRRRSVRDVPSPPSEASRGRSKTGGDAAQAEGQVADSPGQDAASGGSTGSPPPPDAEAQTGAEPASEPAEGASPSPARSRPVTAEERRKVLAEPMVQKTLDLFDGELADIQKSAPPAPGEDALDTEADDEED